MVSSRARVGVAVAVAALAACAGDTTTGGADADGSTDASTTHDPTTGTTSGTSDGTPTTAVDGSDTSSSSGSSGGETTEGATPGPDLRVFYNDESDPDVRVLTLVDLIDGVLGDPIAYFPTQVDAVATLVTDRWLVAREFASPATLTLLDLDTPPPFDSHPLELQGSPDDARVLDLAGDRWLVATYGAATDLHVYAIADDGSASSPWHVDGDLTPSAAGGGDIAFVRDGQQVLFAADDEMANTSAIWLAPADEDAPMAFPLVEHPGTDLYGPMLAPDRAGLIYRTGGIIPASHAAHFVDLASDPVGAPIELGALPDTLLLGQLRWAPDSSGVTVLHLRAGDASDLAWIPIADGMPLAPVQLSAGASAGRASGATWSDDARWVALAASDPSETFLVRIVDGVASPEMPVAAAGVQSDPTSVVFSADAQFLYLVLDHDDGGEVARVSLAGDTPSAPESLTPTLVGVWQLLLSADDGTLYVAGNEPGDPVRHAWAIDVSGAEPGAPVRIDEGIARDEELFGGMLTADGSHVGYSVWTPMQQRRQAIVDRATATTYAIAGGGPVGSVWMQPL